MKIDNNNKVQNNVIAISKNDIFDIEIAEYITSDEVSTLDKIMYVGRLKAIASTINGVLKKKSVKEAIEAAADIEIVGREPIRTDFRRLISYGVTKTDYVFDDCEHIGYDFINNINLMFKDYLTGVKTELKAIPQGTDKRIVIESAELITLLKTVMDTAQDVIDQIDETDGVVKVNAPLKLQSSSLKIKKQ